MNIADHQRTPSPDINKVDFKRCDLCTHYPVCDIVKGTTRMLVAGYGENDLPFKPQDLAKICRVFERKLDSKAQEWARQ